MTSLLVVLNGWSVLGTGTWQRQLEGWITLAHEFRGLQFMVEFMAVGGWQSPSHGRGTRKLRIPFRTGQTSHSTGYTASQAAPPAEDHHEVKCEPVEDTSHSNHNTWGAYIGCAGPSTADRPCLSWSMTALCPVTASPPRSNAAVVLNVEVEDEIKRALEGCDRWAPADPTWQLL